MQCVTKSCKRYYFAYCIMCTISVLKFHTEVEEIKEYHNVTKCLNNFCLRNHVTFFTLLFNSLCK